MHGLQGGKMPVLTTNCLWKAVIDEVLQYVAALLLTLVKKKKVQQYRFLKLTVKIELKHFLYH
jgi:hypothetical protein